MIVYSYNFPISRTKGMDGYNRRIRIEVKINSKSQSIPWEKAIYLYNLFITSSEIILAFSKKFNVHKYYAKHLQRIETQSWELTS